MAERTCTLCGKTKPQSAYYTNRGEPRARCIACYNQLRARGISNSKWSEQEDLAVRVYYPEGGAAAVLPHTPGRSEQAIRQRAYAKGVAWVHRTPPAHPYRPQQRESATAWKVPADDRPREIRELDAALRDFRECEPAANLVASLGAAA